MHNVWDCFNMVTVMLYPMWCVVRHFSDVSPMSAKPFLSQYVTGRANVNVALTLDASG